MTPTYPDYAELHCLSGFSFGRGAASADELFARAKLLGYRALAITDECSLAGIVRALEASEEHGLALIVGSEFTLACGLKCVLLCEDLAGYRRLCALITTARRRGDKGSYELHRADLEAGDNAGLLALWLPAAGIEAGAPDNAGTGAQVAIAIDTPADTDIADGRWLQRQFPQRTWLAVELHRGIDDHARLARLLALADACGLPAVASGDVHMHERRRRALQDTLTAIRLGTTVAEAGHALFPNGERHLRSRRALAAIHPAPLLAQTLDIAARCRFSLRELSYRYPKELVPDDHTPTSWLRELTERGLRQRWPEGETAAVRAQVEHELALVAKLGYEAFFLTVEDVVRFARGQGILCQGRGSAANSAVCFALGITEVDPSRYRLLFGRFLSEERNEPPDIDVDFEHQRREQVIQYVYGKYGRERAAIAATVIRWQPRSAAREVGKVLGLSADQQDALSQVFARGQGDAPVDLLLAEQGFDPSSPVLARVLALVDELVRLPRHLSQHVGGFVIADEPLSSLVPVENAAMAGRTIIQWDKDDLETLGLLKVDVLALGMLSCLKRGLDLLALHGGPALGLAQIPAEDPAVYAMLQRADSIGVFQVESRAQMAMLPRLKPVCFYDLVIQVAIVRPGPIQGGMVHPYLRRRSGEEPVDYPSEELRTVFERTLGVPIFQEQVMELSMVAAGFSAGEADQLRRSMAAWQRRGGLEHWRERILGGMAAHGYDAGFAERVFEQIKGFGSYGFPESHAASFALLVYASAWLKCHHPAIFAASLLNSLPMGFYAPAQIVADARRHGVRVLPVDVLASDFDCTLEPLAAAPQPGVAAASHAPATPPRPGAAVARVIAVRQPGAALAGALSIGRGDAAAAGGSAATASAASGPPPLALRLGFRIAEGLGEEAMARVMAARAAQPFVDVGDLATRAQLDRGSLQKLAAAGALKRLAGHRHRALWAIAGTEPAGRSPPIAPPPASPGTQRPPRTLPLQFGDSSRSEARISLRPPDAAANVHADYAALGLSLEGHPLALVRARLQRKGMLRAVDLEAREDGAPVRLVGLVTMRQRPGTASGVTFVTVEDETGQVNLVVWRQVAERYRRALLESRLLAVRGRLQAANNVRHVIVDRMDNADALLPALAAGSRDFH
jgi:error-prone DNA polymerase